MEIILDLVLIIAAAVAAIGLTLIGWVLYTVARNQRLLPSAEQIWEGRDQRYALIIYQPSPHGTVDAMVERAARVLHHYGYTVTLNYPSKDLHYDMEPYRVVLYATGIFLGKGSRPLLEFVKAHPFTGKKVFLLTVGKSLEEKEELERMEELIAEGNFLCRTKVCKGQEDVVAEIVTMHFL